MDILRTPDERFINLPGYDFTPKVSPGFPYVEQNR